MIDRLVGSGMAPGASVFEAHQALSRRAFIKCCGIAVKELSETTFWLMVIRERGWITPSRLDPLLSETHELLAILNAMIARTKRRTWP